MALQRVSGVHSADVSYEAGRAVVKFDPAITSPEEFMAELERLTGFKAKVDDTKSDDTHGERMHDIEVKQREPEDAS